MSNRLVVILFALLASLVVGCTSSTTPNPPPVATATVTPAATATTIAAVTRAMPSPTATSTPSPTSTPKAAAVEAKIILIGRDKITIQIPNNETDRPKTLSIPAAVAVLSADGSVGTMTACGADTRPLPVFGQEGKHSRLIDAIPGGKTIDITIVPGLGVCTLVLNTGPKERFFAYHGTEDGGDTRLIIEPR